MIADAKLAESAEFCRKCLQAQVLLLQEVQLVGLSHSNALTQCNCLPRHVSALTFGGEVEGCSCASSLVAPVDCSLSVRILVVQHTI